MASHRAQAQFARSRWRLVILIPFWVLQLTLTLALVGLFIYRLSDSMIHYENRERMKGLWPRMEIAWECANIALSVVSIACTCFEIARYIGEALTPWIMVFTHVTKLCCASAILSLGVVIHVKRIDKLFSAIGLALASLLLILAILLTVYVFIAYRRLVTFEDHPHTVNVKGYGFNDGVERRSSYTAILGNIRPTLEKRVSSTSSYLSLRRPSEPNTATLADFERLPGPYGHERDTGFDDYVARRQSSGTHPPYIPPSHQDVEMAMNTEADWDRSTQTASKFRGLGPDNGTQGDKGDHLVAVGSIMSRPRGAVMPRQPSWQSDHGLISVPEEDDVSSIRSKDKKDRQALLGNGRRQSDEEVVPQDVDIAEPRWLRR